MVVHVSPSPIDLVGRKAFGVGMQVLYSLHIYTDLTDTTRVSKDRKKQQKGKGDNFFHAGFSS